MSTTDNCSCCLLNLPSHAIFHVKVNVQEGLCPYTKLDSTGVIFSLRPKKYVCVFQVSRPYLGFCTDSEHFIVNCEQNVVKFAGNWGKMYWKMLFLYKIFRQNKMLCRPTILSFFRAETWNTHIFFFFFALLLVLSIVQFQTFSGAMV